MNREGWPRLLPKNARMRVRGLEVGVQVTDYCEYILMANHEITHFSTLGADYAQVDQQCPRDYTHSRNYWQQLPETPPNLQSA